MKLEVIHKNIFGRDRFYPNSEDARLLLSATGAKSFTKKQLLIYIRAGWDVIVKQQSYTLEDGDE